MADTCSGHIPGFDRSPDYLSNFIPDSLMIPSFVKVLSVGLVPFLMGGLIGCGDRVSSGLVSSDVSSSGPVSLAPKAENLIEIERLKQEQSNNFTVFLKGTVGKKAPFLGSAAYQLQDATGNIWVLTDKNLPSEGKELLVKGKVKYQSITVGEQDLGEFYLVELETIECKASPSSKTIKELCQQK